jgi:hypothetical protein
MSDCQCPVWLVQAVDHPRNHQEPPAQSIQQKRNAFRTDGMMMGQTHATDLLKYSMMAKFFLLEHCVNGDL